MSQYKDQITGRVIYDLRCKGSYLLDYAKIAYNKTYQFNTNPWYPEFGQMTLKSDNTNKLFSSSSLYMKNYVLSGIRNITENNIDFTISAWIYPIATSNRVQSIGIGKRDNNNLQNFYLFRPSYDAASSVAGTKTSIGFSDANNSISYTNYPVNIALSINTWYHLAMTKQGNIVRFYINGQKVITKTTPLTILDTDLEILCLKEDAMCIGEATVILDQALWTGDSFEVPNNFLTGTKEFDSKYVIWNDKNTPTITGDVILDARVTRDRKVRNYGSIQFKGTSGLGGEDTLQYIDTDNTFHNIKISSDENFHYGVAENNSIKMITKGNTSGNLFRNLIKFIPKANLTIPIGSTTSKFTTSIWCKLDPVINTNPWKQHIYFSAENDNDEWLRFPVWFLGIHNPGMQIRYKKNYNESYTADSTNYYLENNRWTHLAFVKDGINLYTFVNGVSVLQQNLNYINTFNTNSTPIITDNFNMIVKYLIIQCSIKNSNSLERFYVDDIVLIKDQALWTSNFTPPNDYITGPKALTDGEVVFNPLYSANVFDY